MKKYRDQHGIGGWDRISGLFKNKARVPYLYLVPKLKDINKLRPLASYFRHPLKYVYKYAGMALIIILKALTNTHHFNLFRTYDTLDHLEKIFQEIENLEKTSPDLHISTYAGDVKQLFTELPHEEVIDAMKWAIEMVRKTKKGRSKYSVTLNKIDKKMSRMGPTYDDIETIEVTFQEIIQIVRSDMGNSFFKINEEIIRQIFGIPQGSPLSPALAQCVLMYFEHKFLSSIYDNTHFMGIRYFDDIRLIVISLTSKQEDIEESEKLIGRFIASLPESLVLEPEPNEDNRFRFLEAHISMKEKTSFYYSKNYEAKEEIIPQDLTTYPFQTYFGSYMQNPKQEIKNNVRTRLEAIENYSRDEKCIERGVTSSIGDFYCSGFPKSIILETTYNFAEKVSSRPREWRRMIDHLKKMYPEQSYRVRCLKQKLKNKLRRHKKKCT